jgi:hypothetical protein
MKAKRFTEEQIIAVLKEAETGAKTMEPDDAERSVDTVPPGMADATQH